MKYRRIVTGIITGLTAIMLLSGEALADGIILAPGVELSGGQKSGPAGPGGAQQSDGSASGTGETGVIFDPVSAQQTSGTAQTSGIAQTSADTESLIAASLADPYTVFPAGEPGIFVSRGRMIDASKPMLALTFDDGPRTDTGSRIMNAFEQYGQRATFYLVGSRVASRADEVKRMASSGHELGNHSYSHTYFNRLDAEGIRSEVRSCNDIIEQTTGVRPRTMRLPGGIKDGIILENIGMPVILWSIDTRDWEHRNTSAAVSAVIGKVRDGDIILMHELYESTASAVEQLVPQLVEQGFQLVTVSEMAAVKGTALSDNAVYYSL